MVWRCSLFPKPGVIKQTPEIGLVMGDGLAQPQGLPTGNNVIYQLYLNTLHRPLERLPSLE